MHGDAPPYTDHDIPVDHSDNVAPIRTPAQNRPAEQALLGAILLEPARATQLADHVDADDFYDPRHETIWHAIHTVVERHGVPPDHVMVANQLRETGHLARLAGYLTELPAACPTPQLAEEYARQVRDAARIRRVTTALTRGLQMATTATPDTLPSVLGDLMDVVDEVTVRTGPTIARSAVDYVPFTGLFSRPRTPVQWVMAPVLAAGRITLLYSPGKTGKSLIAMEAAAALATGRAALAADEPGTPQHVLYIDQEMTEDDWTDRLTDMGYGPTDEPLLAEHLHLAQLQVWPPMDTPAGGRAVEQAVAHTGATVVIIDTASKVIAGEENSNDTQQAFYRNTLIPLKRAGAAVLVLDHTGKDLERGARGGSAKTDNIDLAFELIKRGRDTLTMRCTHARIRHTLLEQPTLLRRTSEPLAHLIETHDLSDEAAGAVRPTYLMERVSRYIEANPGHSKTAIETAVKGKAEYVRLALELLVTEQHIETRRGPRNATTHHCLTPFREEPETNE